MQRTDSKGSERLVSLLVLITGNEPHMTFKTRKVEKYVRRPLDLILYQSETARRDQIKFIQILTTLKKLFSFLFPFYWYLFEYGVFNIVILIIYIILSSTSPPTYSLFSHLHGHCPKF